MQPKEERYFSIPYVTVNCPDSLIRNKAKTLPQYVCHQSDLANIVELR